MAASTPSSARSLTPPTWRPGMRRRRAGPRRRSARQRELPRASAADVLREVARWSGRRLAPRGWTRPLCACPRRPACPSSRQGQIGFLAWPLRTPPCLTATIPPDARCVPHGLDLTERTAHNLQATRLRLAATLWRVNDPLVRRGPQGWLGL